MIFNFQQLLEDMRLKHPEGIALIGALYQIVGFWDDLIDRDNDEEALDKDTINKMFRLMLLEFPNNPLFLKHRTQYTALLDTAFTCYEVSQKWEEDKDEHGLELGHVLRYQVATAVGFTVRALYGPGIAAQVLPEYYKRLCSERFSEYLKEHLGEHK